MGRMYKGIKWFVYVSGGIIAITTLCIIVGILLEEMWGLNTLNIFYTIASWLFVISMIFGIPFCIGGIYILNTSRKVLGGKG